MLWLRFLKMLGVALYAAGLFGALMPGVSFADRRKFVFAYAGPGFGITWAFGFVLLSVRGHSVMSTWVLGSLALSVMTLNVLLYLAGKEDRGGRVSTFLALSTFALTVALMVWRPA